MKQKWFMALLVCLLLPLLSARAQAAGDELSAEKSLPVKQSMSIDVPLTALRVESSRLSMNVGESLPFQVELVPEDATDRLLTYSSSNEKVATVDEAGVIHALKPGQTRLTARSQSGKRVRVTLSVQQPVAEILPDKAEYTLNAGRTLTLKTTLLPADATQKRLTYASSDPDVATVNGRGRVTGKKPGEVTITLRAESGVQAICRVRVVQPVKAVRTEKSRLTLSAGQRQTLGCTVSPASATDQTLVYSSDCPEVMSVDPESGLLTALSAGSATLTVRAHNGKSARVRVTVVQPVTDVSVSSPSLTLERGDSLRLSAQVLPDDATDKRLTYASSDKAVATVSSSGTIKAKKAGSCLITLTAKSGATAQVRLTVTQPVTRVAFSFSRKTIGKYETVAFSPAVLPGDATDPALLWSSSNPRVASVTQEGELTGHQAGEAVITARAASGKKDSFRVTVKEFPLTGLMLNRLFMSLTPGQAGELGAQALPLNATEQQITYESSHPEVASVDERGRVLALSLGEATITARTAGEVPFTRTCRVVVAEQPVKRLEGVTIGLNAGHQTRTNATPIPIAPGARETVYSIKVGSAGVVTRVPEYEVNLQVALRLQQLLEAEGATVVMVRTSNDINLSNIERAHIMNDAQCDLALQIHCNGSQNRTRTGFSIYTQQLGSVAARSQELGRAMLPTILEITGANDAGCHASAGYASLNWSSVPSVLLEMGYLSNPAEDRKLASAEYQMLLAQAICESLCVCFAD